MSVPVWKRSEIESPCVQLCVVHPETRLCTGCARSMDEIANWGSMSPEARRRVMDELPERQPVPNTRRGGRAGRIKRTS